MSTFAIDMKYLPLLSNKNIKKSAEIKIQFLADIEFGIPSKKCKNFGICRINPINSTQSTDEKKCCKSALVKAIVTLFNENHVELDFLKSTIATEVYQKFFQDNYFLVQEIFQDNFYGNANYNCTILPGKYRAIENNGLIKIIYN